MPLHVQHESEYLARINQENHLKHEIQRLTQALALQKQNTVTLVAQAQQQAKAQPKSRIEKASTTDQQVNLDHQTVAEYPVL